MRFIQTFLGFMRQRAASCSSWASKALSSARDKALRAEGWVARPATQELTFERLCGSERRVRATAQTKAASDSLLLAVACGTPTLRSVMSHDTSLSSSRISRTTAGDPTTTLAVLAISAQRRHSTSRNNPGIRSVERSEQGCALIYRCVLESKCSRSAPRPRVLT
jgi:hypothetical protein